MKFGLQIAQLLPDEYLFGTLPKEVLQPDGQWDKYLPRYEPQAENYETHGCTVWGTQNAIETLHKRLYGVEPNYSERFTYVLAGIRPPGTDPQIAAETIRKTGLVDAQLYPIPATYEEFIDPDEITGSLLAAGQNWLRCFVFKHEWVLTRKTTKDRRLAAMMDALRFSPLGVSVTSWFEEGGVYVDRGQPNNHWCMCYGWNDKGWKIFDSYDHSLKIVSFDHDIRYAKRFYLAIRVPKDGAFARLVAFIRGIISR